MTFANLITEKNFKTVANYGFAGVAFFALLWLFANSMIPLTEKVDANTTTMQTVNFKLDEVRDDGEDLKEELLREVRRGNEIAERNCQNAANNDKEFRNCTIPE